MERFKWNFYKTLEFVDNKIPNIEIKKKTFLQLKKIAMNHEEGKNYSSSWQENECSDPEELLLRNTFLNSSKFLILRHKENNPRRESLQTKTKKIHEEKMKNTMGFSLKKRSENRVIWKDTANIKSLSQK